jgi:hypothetical protein
MERINTKYLLAEVRDRVDDMNAMGSIPDNVVEKLVSPKRLVRALNAADIFVCGSLRIHQEVAQLVPAGVTDISMKSDKSGWAKSEVSESEKVDPVDIGRFISLPGGNVNATQVRGSQVYFYNKFPLGDDEPFAFADILHGDEFHHRLWLDIANKVVTYDPHVGRMRMSESMGADCYIAWSAYVLPSSIETKGVNKNTEDRYRIVSPQYAESLLATSTLARLLPVGAPGRQELMVDEQNLLRAALAARPKNTSPIQIDPVI